MKNTKWFAIALIAGLCCVPANAQRTSPTGIVSSSILNPLSGNLSVQDAGTCSTAGSFLWQQLANNAYITTVNLSGTFSGTLTVRESNNNGSVWTTAGTITSAGTTSYQTNGYTDFCVDLTTFTSGVFQISITTGSVTTSPGGVPATNGIAILQNALQNVVLGAIAAPTISQGGTPGSTAYQYWLVPSGGSGASPSAPYGIPTDVSTATGNATLSGTNTNILAASAAPSGAIVCNVFRGNSQGYIYLLTSQAVSGGNCPSYTDTGTAGTQLDPFTLITAGIYSPLIENIVVVDGCVVGNPATAHYACNVAGVKQAILDANGHGGVAGVVFIPPTAMCSANVTYGCGALQALQLGTTTLTVPSLTYILGAGRYASEFDYTGTGCAFAFTGPVNLSGLIGIGLEQDAGNASSGICITGSSGNVASGLIFKDLYIGNNVAQYNYVTNQTGIKITPTPSGANGSIFIHDNTFEDVRVDGLYNPISSTGDFQNRWDVQINGVGASQTAFSGCFVSDSGSVRVNDGIGVAAQASTVAFAGTASTCTNNQFTITANLAGSGAKMLNDSGSGNILTVIDSNAIGIGTPSSTSLVNYCEPVAPYCFELLPQVAFAGLPGSPVNGTTILCTNCTSANPCASGGSGALAKRIAGAWVCN